MHIRIEGKEAVQALLRPRGDSIDLHSCRRDDTTYVFPWRTRIVGGAAGPPKAPTKADSVAAFTAAVDAILADDSSAAHREHLEPPATGRPDSAPDVHVQFGRMEAADWAAPSIERLRSWRWRGVRFTVDSMNGVKETSGLPPSKAFTAFPSSISLTFGIRGDTAHVIEERLLPPCMAELHHASPVWWMAHVLVRTPSGWREVRTKSAMARTGCN